MNCVACWKGGRRLKKTMAWLDGCDGEPVRRACGYTTDVHDVEAEEKDEDMDKDEEATPRLPWSGGTSATRSSGAATASDNSQARLCTQHVTAEHSMHSALLCCEWPFHFSSIGC